MTEARTGPPPEKEKATRLGTTVAHLEDNGNRYSSHLTENLAAFPAAIGTAATRRWHDCGPLDRWCIEHASAVYPVLLLHGVVSDDGSKLRVGTVEIDLKGADAGCCVDIATGRPGQTLYDLSQMTGLRFSQVLSWAAGIVAEIVSPTAAANCENFERLAMDIAPYGELRRYVPKWPGWCRQISGEVLNALDRKAQLTPKQIRLLLKAHARATASREEQRLAAERKRETREVLSCSRGRTGAGAGPDMVK